MYGRGGNNIMNLCGGESGPFFQILGQTSNSIYGSNNPKFEIAIGGR